MNYVMSDIHGEYDKYIKMIKHIKLSDDDTLYILGDVVDRGPKPVEVLLDMASRCNVYPIMGNHEVMAISVLKQLYTEISDESINNLNPIFMEELNNWMENGGKTTLDGFKKLAKDEALDLIDYLQDFSFYESVDVNDKSYLMVHASLDNFDENRDIDDYRIEELAFNQMDYNKRYFSDPSIYIISGHIPTFTITGKPRIIAKNHHLAIDCGACFNEGKLACICLDTMKVTYL